MMKRNLIATTIGTLMAGGTTPAQPDLGSNTGTAPRFESYDTLLDAMVASAPSAESSGSKASIDDFVVDTRNGRITFAIIHTNGILGTANKVVAIPYGALTWHPEISQFTLAATADELRSLPPFIPGDLSRLHDQSWQSALRAIFAERDEIEALGRIEGDEYSPYFADTRQVSRDGRIVVVTPKAATANGNECCAIVVEDDEHDRQTVFLAPMAYLISQSALPSAGDEVGVTTVRAIDAKGNAIRVASSVRVDGKTIRLRDKKGIPAWSRDGMSRPYDMLASKLDDGALYGGGEKFGTVDDVVCEVSSGATAFAIVSVGGVLGIDDTLYPVPCGVISMTRDSNLFVDMPNAKLKLAPKLSEDGASDLNEASYVKRVYQYFDLEPKTFDIKRPHRWMKEQDSAGHNQH